MVGTKDNLLAVVRPEGTAIVTEFICQTANVFAVSVHGVNIQVPIAHRGEYEFALTRDGCFRVVPGSAGQLLQVRTIRPCRKNVERRVDSPDITLRKVRTRRTLFRAQVS